MIHFLLTPLMLFSSILTEITLNENHRIKGIVVTADTQVDMDLMAVTPGDWILMKGLIESNDGECKAIINDGHWGLIFANDIHQRRFSNVGITHQSDAH